MLRRAEQDVDGSVSFVMEPTGLAGVPIAACVGKAGHRVYLAHRSHKRLSAL